MSTFFFYQPEVENNHSYLSDEEFLHCTRVLRKKAGDQIGILDGKGKSFTAEITEITSKHCRFEVLTSHEFVEKPFSIHIAIAPTKNIDRTEWFVEKACELGVNEISFILTKNTERNKLRTDRLNKKAISALKQSKSGFLTTINELVPFDHFLDRKTNISGFIAVVEPGLHYLYELINPNQPVTILIGPEGDFSPAEIKKSVDHGYQKISLGSNTLRTETAGVIASQVINIKNRY